MFDLSFIDKDAILNELKLLNSEILLETHSERKLIILKSKIGGLNLTSPMSGSNGDGNGNVKNNSPSSIILASHEYDNEFIFNEFKKDENIKKSKYIIKLR